MFQQAPISAASFFSNAAAQEAGLSGQFWLDAYNRYVDAMEQDTAPFFERWEMERTVRVPFKQDYFDVLIRSLPEGREFCPLRFTAFPASGEPQPPNINRWYWYDDSKYEDPSLTLPEATLLDYTNRW